MTSEGVLRALIGTLSFFSFSLVLFALQGLVLNIVETRNFLTKEQFLVSGINSIWGLSLSLFSANISIGILLGHKTLEEISSLLRIYDDAIIVGLLMVVQFLFILYAMRKSIKIVDFETEKKMELLKQRGKRSQITKKEISETMNKKERMIVGGLGLAANTLNFVVLFADVG